MINALFPFLHLLKELEQVGLLLETLFSVNAKFLHFTKIHCVNIQQHGRFSSLAGYQWTILQNKVYSFLGASTGYPKYENNNKPKNHIGVVKSIVEVII